MNTTPEFTPWPKIARLNRICTITEKLDGTNASILITDTNEFYAGSRTRWITPDNDNYGFAKWAYDHKDELITGLGPGHHFGEWWGTGIQRRYNIPDKRFSLFNTHKWNTQTPPPACCSVVPVLFTGLFTTALVTKAIEHLKLHGSMAAFGFMNPEGIVIYHHAAKTYYKVTLDKDNEPKSLT